MSGGDDGRVRLDDKLRRFDAQFTPGDFFVGYRARIRSKAGGGIADLAEITPDRSLLLSNPVGHRHHADSGKSPRCHRQFEKAGPFPCRFLLVPFRESHHVLNAAAS